MRLTGLRIETVRKGISPGIGACVIRWGVLFLPSIAAVIKDIGGLDTGGLFFVLWPVWAVVPLVSVARSDTGRGLHDIASGTAIV